MILNKEAVVDNMLVILKPEGCNADVPDYDMML